MLVPLKETKPPSFDVDVIPTPGATISGLTRPSAVGPLLLKSATLFPSSTAPTVNPNLEHPGELIVLEFGPEFPAATTTIKPLLTTLSTLSDNISVPSHPSISAPRLKLAISAPLLNAQSSPSIKSEASPKPSPFKTFTSNKLAPEATPLNLLSCDPTIPATCVPWPSKSPVPSPVKSTLLTILVKAG